MIGARAKAEQFFGRTANESTKGSRKGYSLLGGGENPVSQLTPEELRASLVQKLKGLNAALILAKKGKDKRRVIQLGKDISETCMEINAMRPKLKSFHKEDVIMHFIDICRENMTKPQFNAIMDEANKRVRAVRGERGGEEG